MATRARRDDMRDAEAGAVRQHDGRAWSGNGSVEDVMSANSGGRSDQLSGPVASDALLEGFCRGVALCEDVVRCALPDEQDGGVLQELAALSQEARDRRVMGAQVSIDPRYTAPHGDGARTSSELAEVNKLRADLHQRDQLLAQAQDSVAIANRDVYDLRHELREKDRQLAAVTAREAAAVAEIRAELEKRNRQILRLQADLARAYSTQLQAGQKNIGALPGGKSGLEHAPVETHMEVTYDDADAGGGVAPVHALQYAHPHLPAAYAEYKVPHLPSTCVVDPAASQKLGSNDYMHAEAYKDFGAQNKPGTPPPLPSTRRDGGSNAIDTYSPEQQQRNVDKQFPKGSYVQAAGKVYWINYEDPLDVQRLPDSAVVPGDAASRNEEPILPGTPEPNTRGAAGEPQPPPQIHPTLCWTGRRGSGGQPDTSAPHLGHHHTDPELAHRPEQVPMVAAWSARAPAGGSVVIGSNQLDGQSYRYASEDSTPTSHVARRQFSEPRLGRGGRVAVAPPVALSSARMKAASGCDVLVSARGAPMSARNNVSAQRSWSPVPWSPSPPPPPLSARSAVPRARSKPTVRGGPQYAPSSRATIHVQANNVVDSRTGSAVFTVQRPRAVVAVAPGMPLAPAAGA